MAKSTPNESINSKISVETLQPHLTPEQYEEVRQARLKALQAAIWERINILNKEISENTKSVLNSKVSNWQEIVEEKWILDKVEELPIIGGVVSAARNPRDTAEWVADKVLSVTGTDSNFVVNNDVSTVFKEKGIWEGIKYLFSQIKGIFSAGFSLDAFSRLGDLLKGNMDTGKKVSELVDHYNKMLDLAVGDRAVWKNAMLDQALLDIPFEKLRSNMNAEDISKTLKLDDISSADAKKFLQKLFDAKNFEKIIADYKAKANISDIDEKKITLKDIFLKVIENSSK